MKFCFVLFCLFAVPAIAAPNPKDFHRAVYALHEKQIAQREIRIEEETGDYEGAAAARFRYVDTRYYDKASGNLISHIRRDAAMPELIHIAEVNVYDDAGKLVRDFGSVTLPWAPLHPVRTFIKAHRPLTTSLVLSDAPFWTSAMYTKHNPLFFSMVSG